MIKIIDSLRVKSYPVHICYLVQSPSDLVSNFDQKVHSSNSIAFRCIRLWCTDPQWRNAIAIALATLYLYDDTEGQRRDATILANELQEHPFTRTKSKWLAWTCTTSPVKVDGWVHTVTFIRSSPIPLGALWDRPSAGVEPHQPEPRTRFQSFAMWSSCKIPDTGAPLEVKVRDVLWPAVFLAASLLLQ